MKLRTAVESRFERQGTAAAGLAACLCLLLSGSASAATVANGDFEAGSLSGWTVVNSTPETGSWFAYSGTDSPWEKAHPFALEPGEELAFYQVPPPPQGTFAALSDQEGPGAHILYQDIALEPGATHTLAMTVYYHSRGPIAVPMPDSLDPGPVKGGEVMLEAEEPPANQQYRVEVIKPSAALDTVNPDDILATVFRTANGAPQELGPTTVTADLSGLAGQTVRLRLVEVDNRGNFNAGADAITVTSVPINQFTLSKKLNLNRKKGTAKLGVKVPNPGIVKSLDVRAVHGKAAASRKKKPARVKPSKVTATAAGKVFLKLGPTAAGRRILEATHKLAFKIRVTYTPTGGTAASQTFKGTLKLK